MIVKDYRMYPVLFVFMVWVYIPSVDCLDCYTCDHVNATKHCQSMTTCKPNEDCFTDIQGIGNRYFHLGCRPHDQCLRTVTQSPAIVGRSVAIQSSCSRCCSLDGCNQQLCAFENQLINEKGPCEDDPDFNCVQIGSALNVCGDVQHAKLICRKYCNLCDIVDGAWTNWNSWSHCDVTCDAGHMTRTRTCTNPVPEHGGLDCVGLSTVRTSCNLRICPTHGQWSLWAQWETCSVTCGIGLQRRYRNCSNPFPSSDGHYCFGNNMDARVCSEKPCGGWSGWSSWGKCSKSCGVGQQASTRTCSSSNAPLSGNSCIGSATKTQLCTLPSCADPIDCIDALHQYGTSTNGVYNVQSHYNGLAYRVYCDMTTDGGGWTVFQKRIDGSLDFYKTFKEYENGFGDVHAEFWMGLKHIHEMTSKHTTELRIDLTAADGTTAYETYQNFYLSPGPDYTLHVGQAAGTAGNRLSYNNNYKFSTKDKDVDGRNGDCAESDHGGWWYDSCTYVNLNGDYGTPGTTSSYNSEHGGEGGVIYRSFKSLQSLKRTQMMFRRK